MKRPEVGSPKKEVSIRIIINPARQSVKRDAVYFLGNQGRNALVFSMYSLY
jgi:hypothetical protein